MAGTLKVSKITNDQGFTKGNLIPYAEAGDVGQGGRQFIYVVGSVEWVVHEFREDGMFWLPSNKVCDIFMIGGGGSGGPDYGNQDTGQGGGGAGGALWRQGYTVTAGSYDIHIGEGGRRSATGSQASSATYEDAAYMQQQVSQNGADTWAFNVIARGGGSGGGSDNLRIAQKGGCGGGGGARNSNGGDWNNGRPSTQDSYTGWTSYGNSGGNSANGNYSGGGGGGIGGAGGNQSGGTNDSNSQAGSGGAGLDFSGYFGTTVGHFGWFGGGGGGGTYRHGTNTMYNAPPNAGGYGGGGFGNSAREGSQTSPNVYSHYQLDGMNGTGGGGGGAVEDHDEDEDNKGSAHGKGGSGAVVIRYQL